MNKWGRTCIAMVLLTGCLQQNMPTPEELPGKECKLVTNRLLAPVMATQNQDTLKTGKPIALRESEEERLRQYLAEFTKTGQISYTTYAPRTVLYGEYFTLNFQQNTVILSIGKKEKTQYERARRAEDDAMLKLLRKRSSAHAISR